ncbi:MAG: DJ-1/PfpI family protein [Myxococcota bacterium]
MKIEIEIDVLVALSPQDFRDQEALRACDVFRDRGFRVQLASTRSGPVYGMFGTELVADAAFDWVEPDRYDALIVIGGTGAQVHLWEHPDLRRIVRSVHERYGIVAAGSCASTVLARAEVLRGREVTMWHHAETLSELHRAGAQVSQRPVVVSGNIITLSDSDEATAWAESAAALLVGHAASRSMAQPSIHAH